MREKLTKTPKQPVLFFFFFFAINDADVERNKICVMESTVETKAFK